MAENRKISDLENIPGVPLDNDYFLLAREDINNYKVRWEVVENTIAEEAKDRVIDYLRPRVVWVHGEQTIVGHKVFAKAITGNLTGTAKYVEYGVYTKGDQRISGRKDFVDGDLFISGKNFIDYIPENILFTTGEQTVTGPKVFSQAITGNLTGTAKYVEFGVYTKGDQEITGRKDFVGDLFLSGKPILDYKPKDLVYTTGDQSIDGHKQFLKPITGSLSGTALYVRSGVYTSGDQQITGRKDFVGDLFLSGKPILDYKPKDVVYLTGEQTISGPKEFLEPITGSLSGTALYVRSGVYTSGDQQITGRKDFVGDLFLSGKPILDYQPKDVVYLTGEQTISGPKEFLEPITGSLSGTALYVRSGVYTSGDQQITGRKDFVGDLFLSGKPILDYQPKDVVYLTGEQTISGPKEFLEPITGSLSGTALYVRSGVYTSGDQQITGRKDFVGDLFLSGKPILDYQPKDVVYLTGEQTISGPKEFLEPITGSLSGTALYVRSGVYTSGDQQITGRKDFVGDLFLSGKPILDYQPKDVVYLTGEQTISGPKEFLEPITGSLSGTALYVRSGVYTSGDQQITGRKDFVGDLFLSGKPILDYQPKDVVYLTGEQTISGPKEFLEPITGSLSGTALYVRSGVYTSGDQQITGRKDFVGDLFLSGKPILDHQPKDVVYLTGEQVISGTKIFESAIAVSGGLYNTGANTLSITDGRDPKLFQNRDGASLSLAFESGVYITGGADLHIEGKLFADEIDAVETIVGDSGAMVLTDGRDPALFEGEDKSLSLAFESGVYITGGADLHIEGKLFADEIDAVETIVGDSGAMVLTDGRDPALFEGEDKSLSLAFESGVYITGGADLHIEGKLFADEIDAVETIVGDSGAMVLTDGRDPALFEGEDKSLSLAFESGVYITGGADLHIEGKLFADEIDAVETIVGDSGAMVLTDGRDPALFEGEDKSLSLAFESGVYITGGADLHIEGKLFADEIDAVETIVGDSGAMVLTDGRDPALFEGGDKTLALAFGSGVYITGGADLHIEGKLFADEIDTVETIVGDSGSMVLTDGRDPTLFEGPNKSLSLAFESGVYITGDTNLHVKETGYFKSIEVEVPKYYEVVNSNFWWNSNSSKIYIPIIGSEHSISSSQDVMGETDGYNDDNMYFHHMKLMSNKGRVKKITFSITETNPKGFPDVQFDIIKGSMVRKNELLSAQGSNNNFYFIDKNGDREVNKVASSDFEFPEWDDVYQLYNVYKEGETWSYPCARTNDIASETSSPDSYNSPQKYKSYSYCLPGKELHYEEGSFIAIRMNKFSEDGSECYQGNINQGIFVSIIFENHLEC